jgi:DNA-binding transcriptional MerR regulator
MSTLRDAELLSIGDLARRVGAAPSALRYWERAGLLAPVTRIGDRRRYAAAAVDRVGLIRLCQDAGFGIGEIRVLLDRDPEGREAWRTYAATKLAEVREEIARLESAATVLEHTLACPAPSLADCQTFAKLVQHRATGAPLPADQRPAGRHGVGGRQGV